MEENFLEIMSEIMDRSLAISTCNQFTAVPEALIHDDIEQLYSENKILMELVKDLFLHLEKITTKFKHSTS